MHLRPFEIGLIAFFGIAAIIGLIVISLYQAKPSSEKQVYGDRVIIWGTLPEAPMTSFLTDMVGDIKELSVVTYVQIDERVFDETLLNAIAEGNSPDMLILPHSLLVKYRSKLTAIAPEVISERMFRDTYIDGADIFRMSDGVYGIPFAVDPMVMYWNRDMFSSAGIASPPKTWEQLVANIVPTLTKMDASRTISQSAVSFGGYDNVSHAKDTLSLLFIQSGEPIVVEKDKKYQVTLRNTSSEGLGPQSIFNFYTQFSNPESSLYTWNKSKPNDLEAFSLGELGIYFGNASEWAHIGRTNPNLNYDVASVPQGEGATISRTYGTFYAFAIPRASQRAQGAFAVAQLLTSTQYAEKLARMYDFAPVQRSLITTQSNPNDQVRYESALYARGWLDPSPQKTDQIFHDAVDGFLSNNRRSEKNIADMIYQLESLF